MFRYCVSVVQYDINKIEVGQFYKMNPDHFSVHVRNIYKFKLAKTALFFYFSIGLYALTNVSSLYMKSRSSYRIIIIIIELK